MDGRWSRAGRMLIIAAALVLGAGCDQKSGQPEPDDEPTAQEPAAESAEETEASDGEEPKKSEGSEQAANLEIVPLQHGSLMLKWDGRVIAVDPVASALKAHDGPAPMADLVLVTHIHGDHLDPASIAKVRKEEAPVIAPQSVVDKAGDDLPNPTVMANGDQTDILGGAATLEAIPAYNQKRKRENGEFFHPKGRDNGYVLTLGDERVYISGDTECTPEMKALENIDRAFVCMNLPYTMPPKEAAECVRSFKPKRLYPYHFRGQDPPTLNEMLSDVDEVEIELLDWYPTN